jgi:hypothetical protein
MSLAFDPANWRDHYKGVKSRIVEANLRAERQRLANEKKAEIEKARQQIADLANCPLTIYDGPVGPLPTFQGLPADVIKPIEEKKPESKSPLRDLLYEVAHKHGLQPGDIRGEWRIVPVVFARHVFMYRARSETKASLPQIGRFLGMDHTSVLHGIRKIEGMIQRGELTL